MGGMGGFRRREYEQRLRPFGPLISTRSMAATGMCLSKARDSMISTLCPSRATTRRRRPCRITEEVTRAAGVRDWVGEAGFHGRVNHGAKAKARGVVTAWTP